MSEEKKTAWGKAYETSAAQEPKQAVARIEEDVATERPVAAAPAAGDGDADGGPGRGARHQHVLPGILGKQLRAAYGELLNAPVPDAIGELVKRLERQEAERAAAAAAAGKPEDEEGSK